MNPVVIETFYRVEVTTPGNDPYDIKSSYETIESAQFFIGLCLKPKVGKRNGYPRKTVFTIWKHVWTKTPV